MLLLKCHNICSILYIYIYILDCGGVIATKNIFLGWQSSTGTVDTDLAQDVEFFMCRDWFNSYGLIEYFDLVLYMYTLVCDYLQQEITNNTNTLSHKWN